MYILYEGKSRIGEEDIVVIATCNSENQKTGSMIQTWILLKDQNPFEAVKNGDDNNICGSCKHRHFRSCYVNLSHGPYNVYRAYKNNKYKRLSLSEMGSIFAKESIRLGSYGDPVAVPIKVWDSLLSRADFWTGYTHQWRRGHNDYKKYCMASCDTYDEVKLAINKGWKPFYVRRESDPIPERSFTCPASKEAGYRLNCNQCRVCSGGEYKGQGIPTIIVHGPSWKKVFYTRGIKAFNNKKKYVGLNVINN